MQPAGVRVFATVRQEARLLCSTLPRVRSGSTVFEKSRPFFPSRSFSRNVASPLAYLETASDRSLARSMRVRFLRYRLFAIRILLKNEKGCAYA